MLGGSASEKHHPVDSVGEEGVRKILAIGADQAEHAKVFFPREEIERDGFRGEKE